jgi:hypothetical protein
MAMMVILDARKIGGVVQPSIVPFLTLRLSPAVDMDKDAYYSTHAVQGLIAEVNPS